MRISNNQIVFDFDEKTAGFTLQFAGRTLSTEGRFAGYWNPEGEQIAFSQALSVQVSDCPTGFGSGIRAQYTFSDGVEVLIWVFTEADDTKVHFHLEVVQGGETVKKMVWPAAANWLEQQDGCSVLPIMQGILLPNSCPDPANTLFGGVFGNRGATMPWWGEYDGRTGALSIVETYVDAQIDFSHAPGEPTHTCCVWLPVMGDMAGLTRKLHLQLLENCDHVTLCKAFRQYWQDHERFVTLREKAVRNPKLQKMIGTPVLYGLPALKNISPDSAYYQPEHPEFNHCTVPFAEHARMVQHAKALGLERGYYHLDGWGNKGYDNQHPDYLPPAEEAGGSEGLASLKKTCQDAGWLLAYHDQYHDYYYDSPSFTWDQTALPANGTSKSCSTWYGGKQGYLCMSLAPYYVQRNYTQLEQMQLLPDGVYLDCFGILPGEECLRPGHRMTRQQSIEERKRCFRWLQNKGILISSEEGSCNFMDTLDLVHHSPYFHACCIANNLPCVGEPVPLMNLVFHECLLIPWGMGKQLWGIAADEDGMLHCLLNGGLPYAHLQKLDAATAEKMQICCKLNEAVWDQELVAHRFLSADMRRQETEFANGIRVQVDLSENTGKILYPDGTEIFVDASK